MTEKDSTPLRGINYWFVSVKFVEPLKELQEKRNEELRQLFKYQDSTLGVIKFDSNYNRSFVKKANVNDFIIQLMWLNDRYNVTPPREIIQIDEIGSQKYFYFETKKGQIKQVISLKEFQVKLRENKIEFKVNISSVKKISPKYVPEIISIW